MDIYFDKIRITNYRSCKYCELKLERDLNTLIGPNGSGKTTILRAIFLLKQLIREDRMPPSRETSETEFQPTTIKAWLKVNGKTVIHTVDFLINTDENNEDQIVASTQKWYMKDITGGRGTFKLPLSLGLEFGRHYEYRRKYYYHRRFYSPIAFKYLGNEKVMRTLAHIAEFYEKITYYSASQFTNPSRCPVSFEVTEKMRPIRPGTVREGHGKWLYDMFVEYRKKSDEFLQYIDIVGPNGIGLIDNIDFQETEVSTTHVYVKIGGKLRKRKRENILIIPKISIQDNIFSATQLSEGTFKTLAMIFYLMTGRSKVVLLEEPEVCIHHGLLSSLIELIRQFSKEKQLFVSTHSDYILDELNEKNIFVVQNLDDKGIKVKALKRWLSHQDMYALKEFLSSEGSLGEYWRMGGIDE